VDPCEGWGEQARGRQCIRWLTRVRSALGGGAPRLRPAPYVSISADVKLEGPLDGLRLPGRTVPVEGSATADTDAFANPCG